MSETFELSPKERVRILTLRLANIEKRIAQGHTAARKSYGPTFRALQDARADLAAERRVN